MIWHHEEVLFRLCFFYVVRKTVAVLLVCSDTDVDTKLDVENMQIDDEEKDDFEATQHEVEVEGDVLMDVDASGEEDEEKEIVEETQHTARKIAIKWKFSAEELMEKWNCAYKTIRGYHPQDPMFAAKKKKKNTMAWKGTCGKIPIY